MCVCRVLSWPCAVPYLEIPVYYTLAVEIYQSSHDLLSELLYDGFAECPVLLEHMLEGAACHFFHENE